MIAPGVCAGELPPSVSAFSPDEAKVSLSLQSCKGGDMACVRGPWGAPIVTERDPRRLRWLAVQGAELQIFAIQHLPSAQRATQPALWCYIRLSARPLPPRRVARTLAGLTAKAGEEAPIVEHVPHVTEGRDGRPAAASRTAGRDRRPAAGAPA